MDEIPLGTLRLDPPSYWNGIEWKPLKGCACEKPRLCLYCEHFRYSFAQYWCEKGRHAKHPDTHDEGTLREILERARDCEEYEEVK